MGNKSVFLSRTEKESGQRSYLTYTFINGLSYSFLAETIIYLMAMNFGANNIQLGYISSAVYLTGITVFFVPILFPGVKIISLFSNAWLLRGIVSLVYITTLFLPDKVAVITIILVYTVYCLFRNVAYPFNHVIQGYITKPSERGTYASKVMMILYLSMMLSRFISFSTLSLFSSKELFGILALLLFGIVLNTGAAFAIKKVPIREKIQKRNLKEAITTFKIYLKQSQTFLLILLYCGGMSLFVLFNFSIPFLRKDIGITSNIIFIYTTINFLGVILASSFIRPFLNSFGSKPVLIVVNVIIVILSILWAMGSSEINPLLLFLLGFISMFFIGMIRLLLDRLIINSIPSDDRVGFTSVLAVVFSLVSLIIGLSGGYLADFSINYDISVPNDYSLSFFLMAAVALINSIIAILIKEKDSLPVNQFIQSLTDRKQLKTIHNLDRLHRKCSVTQKDMILIEIESDDTHLATREIRKRLKLSTLKDKEMVIRSLFSNPRPELESELIEEALDKFSWWRQSAIFALGAYNSEASAKTLRLIFKEKYPYIKSIAAKSLARLGDYSCHDEINELLEKTTLDVRTYINLIIAISLIEYNGDYWSTIFRLIKDNHSHRFIQSLLIIGSLRLNFKPPIEDLFYELNLDHQEGFNTIFEELVDLDIESDEFELLQEYALKENYIGLFTWCRDRCKKFKLVEPFEKLRLEITSYKKRKIEPSVSLGILYFTIQLEKAFKIQKNRIVSTYKAE